MRKTFDLKTAIGAVETPEVQQLTFRELLEGWCAAHTDPNDPLRIRKWVHAMGDRSAWDITSADLATAALAMQQSGRYKNSSVNRDVATIGSAYKWAITRRIAPVGFVSPSLGVRRFDEAESIRRVFIEPDQLARLRSLAVASSDRRFGMFVALLIDTGARKGELLERTWSDVDLARGEILLHTSKTGKPRILHFREETAALIRRICPSRPDTSLLFPGRDPAFPIDYKKRWARLTADVGLPGLHMHDLRHDAARRLLVAGVPLATAAAVMGHGVDMLTRRYGHLSVDDARSAVHKAWSMAEAA